MFQTPMVSIDSIMAAKVSYDVGLNSRGLSSGRSDKKLAKKAKM